MKRANNLLSLAISLLIVVTAQAQRPKIGLTLSGGGAKGLAHVGVLQAIDSAGLKIDYITGTSMGSIIGAMYASGYSGNQIDSISKGLDWGKLLAGKPQFSDLGIEEKDEYGRYSAEIPMEGLKPQLGTGLIESEEVWLQFSEIFFHVYDQKDFTKFDIPFKCVATDLTSGKAVVLSSGEIVKALRSSMALPGVFSAVVDDSTYLIDGGIVRNFPVSDVIAMGADYVIGVNLFTGLSEAKDLNSSLDVMYQITNYRDAYDLVNQKKSCNILIEPPLDGYSAGSFADGDKILEIGYQMRDQYYPYFKKLADSLNAIAPVSYDPYSRFDAVNTVTIDDYKIEGLEKIDEKVVLQKANLRIGEALTAKDLNNAFRGIYSTLYFSYIYYELNPTKNDHATILVKAKELPQSQFKLGFSYITNTTPAFILNYTMRNLLLSRSRTMIKLAVSEDMKALLEHKQFFGPASVNSLTFAAKHIQQRVNIYSGDDISSQYKAALSALELKYHYYPSRATALGATFSMKKTDFSPEVASTFRFDGYASGMLSAIHYEINTLDRPFLPTKGVEARFNVGMEYNRKFDSEYVGGDDIDTSFTVIPKDPLLRIDFFVNWYKPVGTKTSLIGNFQGGKIVTDQNFYLDNLMVGGNQKLYLNQFVFVGYQEGQLQATSLVSTLLGVQYEAIESLYLIGKANIGIYNFYGSNGWVEDISTQVISGFNASVAYNLSLLPFELGINYSPEVNKVYSNIRIGFIF